MKKRTINKETLEYFDKCPNCKKEIIGSTESQVKYNMKIHIDAKHKEKKNG